MNNFDKMEARIKRMDAMLSKIEERMHRLVGTPASEQQRFKMQPPESNLSGGTYLTALGQGAVPTKNFYGFPLHDSTV